MMLPKNVRRQNRRLILDSLNEETGSNGGDAASARVIAYRMDPQGSSTTEFGFCGALRIRRWYVAADQPDDAQRDNLWSVIVTKMGHPNVANPGGWDGSDDVTTLQQLVEEAIANDGEGQ